MPTHKPSVAGEAPHGLTELGKIIADLEAKITALSADGAKVQKVLNRLQAIETRLAALEAKK